MRRHFVLDRSLVLTDEQVVRVEVVPDRAGVLVVDGEEIGRLQPETTITCRVADRPVQGGAQRAADTVSAASCVSASSRRPRTAESARRC